MGKESICLSVLLLSGCAAPAPKLIESADVVVQLLEGPVQRVAITSFEEALLLARCDIAGDQGSVLACFGKSGDEWWRAAMERPPRETEIVSAKRTASAHPDGVHIEVVAREPGSDKGTLYLYELRGRTFSRMGEAEYDLVRQEIVAAAVVKAPAPVVVDPILTAGVVSTSFAPVVKAPAPLPVRARPYLELKSVQRGHGPHVAFE